MVKYNSRKSRRAQSEMIGLMMIVIIVISSMLLYIVYKINNPERNIKQGFVNKELAYNFLITTNDVNIADCPQHTVVDLITDCASISRNIYCNDKLTCEVLNSTMILLLNRTFEPLGKDFQYVIENTPINITGACKNKEKIQATQSLTLYPSNEKISIVIDLCDAS